MEVTLNGGEFFIYLFYSFFDSNFKWLYVRLNIDSQFQCRQCQDLLENNLAHKRPIEGLCFNFKSECVYYFFNVTV